MMRSADEQRGGGRKTKFEFERDSGNLKKKIYDSIRKLSKNR